MILGLLRSRIILATLVLQIHQVSLSTYIGSYISLSERTQFFLQIYERITHKSAPTNTFMKVSDIIAEDFKASYVFKENITE